MKISSVVAADPARLRPDDEQSVVEPSPRSGPPLALYGVVLLATGMCLYALASLTAAILVARTVTVSTVMDYTLLLAATAMLLGAVLIAADLFILLPRKRQRRLVGFDRMANRKLTVVLTAYNDELSIGDAVRDFLGHELVQRVIVVDNNSRDQTSRVAAEAGATVILERQPGYGRCVFRALQEGAGQRDTDLTLLCEGDGTFCAFDIDKFMAYIPHAEVVNGTRIVEQLRDRETQLTTFMYYGNFVVGKLLEIKHLGQGTFTDVGTTYKLCRNSALKRLFPRLNSAVNLEFNAHFLDTALRQRVTLVECPITFHKRVGVSKGGNTDDWRALRVGLRMIKGILFSWTA